MWSGRRCHPDDLRECKLTGTHVHFEFTTSGARPRLQPLVDILRGIRRSTDEVSRWEDIASQASELLRGSRCRVEIAQLSPDKHHLAVCSQVKTLLGLRVRQAGLLYSIEERSIVGRIAVGKRTSADWVEK